MHHSLQDRSGEKIYEPVYRPAPTFHLERVEFWDKTSE